MNVNDFIRATVHFRINNVPDAALMTWDFRVDAIDDPTSLFVTGSYIASSFISRYYDPFVSLLSSRCVMSEIQLRSWASPTDGYDAVGDLWQGTGTTGMMPLTNTFALRLVRSDFSLRNGRKAYPAVLCSLALADASMDPAVIDSVHDTTEGWTSDAWVVEAGANAIQLGEYVIRKPTGFGSNPTVFHPVLAYSDPYFGTQNTRRP